MRTEQEIRDCALTVTANRSIGGVLASELIALMVATGMIVNKRGWIYWTVQGAPGKPIAHGWAQMIASLTRHSWNGRDLVAEMSKRSVTPADLAAAEREAYVMAEAPAGSAHGRPDLRGMHMGPGHVAPATIERARTEALAEDAERAAGVVVGFDRIGRHGTTSLRIDSADPAEIERQVRAHIRTNRLIASREYDVHVDVPGGVILLDGGRFGRGSISRPAAPRGPRLTPRERTPRADRLAVAFRAFNAQADSGGPGTSAGVISAVESASTLTDDEVTALAESLIERVGRLGLSTPVRIATAALAVCLRGALADVGIAVAEQ